jgi:hypothetical protein
MVSPWRATGTGKPVGLPRFVHWLFSTPKRHPEKKMKFLVVISSNDPIMGM